MKIVAKLLKNQFFTFSINLISSLFSSYVEFICNIENAAICQGIMKTKIFHNKVAVIFPQ